MNQLLESLAPLMRQVCDRIAGPDGPDATQEALIAVYRNLRHLREPAAAVTWARRIAVREAIRIAKQQLLTVDPHSLERSTQSGETAVDLALVMADLPPTHRTVLILRDIEGMAEATIAALLGISRITVRTRAARARARLRQAWFA